MGTFALVAVGTLREDHTGEGVVGAASGGAPFGMAALWVRHCENPFGPGGAAQLRRAGPAGENLAGGFIGLIRFRTDPAAQV
jgi:hypothetical protein